MIDKELYELQLLGRRYKLKVSASDFKKLEESAQLLEQEMNANKDKFSCVATTDLIILTALNICTSQLELNEYKKNQKIVDTKIKELNEMLLAYQKN